MTQAEIDALPEAGDVALYQPDGEPMAVIDANGVRWMLGYVNGIRHKRRMPLR
jgi:hypothetical protein